MPTIYDNIENQFLEGLNNSMEIATRADFCVGYFNLRGWKGVADHVDKWDGGEGSCCRLLIGMQRMPLEMVRAGYSKSGPGIMDNQTANRIKKQLAQEFREQLVIGAPTEEDEKALRKLLHQIRDGKVIVKLFLKYQLHAKLYLTFRKDNICPTIGYLGSSNLTLAGLNHQGELNIDVLEQDAACKLSEWFDERWEDHWCIDISKELVEILDNSWATENLIPPYYIYLKIAYNLSREARAGFAEFKIPRVFQKELLEFQQKAVLVAAHHLNKRGGVIIGDVVGLGKTITATALAKIFEEDFFLETLIICPKNLVNMWEGYAHKYQLRAKVISVTKVQKILPKERRYRLVVIDESHNLRNREGMRYKSIREYLQLNESKVILLTATPYNKTYLDLSTQLALFLDEDTDLGISPERYIESIGGPVQFMAKHQCHARSIAAFEKSDSPDDWRELMRLYLVRRTRSFIKEHYAKTDPEKKRKYLEFADGSRSYFPDRIPKAVIYHFDPKDKNDQYARLYSNDVVDIIDDLDLPRYGLANYIDEKSLLKFTEKEKQIKDNLSRAGKRLMGFCRTNLFKRLESSGYAFLLSLSRHVLRNYLYLHAIENDLEFPIGPQQGSFLDGFIEDEDGDGDSRKVHLDANSYLDQAADLYTYFATKERDHFEWIRAGLFKKSLKTQLMKDSNAILKIINMVKEWRPKDDRQLNALYELCTKTHAKEKLLIFTQFADTARYLAEELLKRGMTQIEGVTGDTDDPTDNARRFSPISNGVKGVAGTPQEIRVLISTDVLSEGQNLQDSHVVLNYDLPWAIIRLIQRAGRVDRIGQKSDHILCYSFLPEDGLENIIKLRGRLSRRISENAEVVGADETFFDGDPINIKDMYNEKSGVLDEGDEGEVDLASYAWQIWKNATDADRNLLKIIPELANSIYGTKSIQAAAADKQGVIVYSRTAEDNDFLVWLNEQGNVITQSQKIILDATACSHDTPALHRLEHHHDLVAKGLDLIKDTESSATGTLGKKSSVRYRVFMHLDRYIKANEGTLFVTSELKRAVDDIFKFPLKELARETIGRHLKTGVSDEGLADLVISLRDDDKLCIVEEEEFHNREPQIICSMGLVNTEG
ncbi:helicase-related protein [Pelobacter propionicus]|uniref:Helicase domain protein n=1 Tax=Pelobacter propionicus (strain DSM 2379 / NBRC 103807 / OttBd1) TaxID=338966 RepID=A0R826_PELPD|nr:helicase-related protein [Pelobacter propionicus]ABL01261.1 helicase domain protein [Pelobacter propionicus DSM 2379]